MPALWPYPARGVTTERLEWLTDVIESTSGVEQRFRLREAPRCSYEYEVLLSERDARSAENLIYGNLHSEWYTPVWPDAERLGTDISAATSVFPSDTATRAYRIGRHLALIDPLNPDHHQVLQISAITPTTLSTQTATVVDWPARATLVPLRTARLPSEVALNRFTGGDWYGQLRWNCTDTVSSWPAAEPVVYRGVPVLTHATDWDSDPAYKPAAKLSVIDSGFGPPAVIDLAGLPAGTQTHRWSCDSRQAADDLRGWLAARYGRFRAFWLPSAARDLLPVATIGAASVNLDVQRCGYTDHVTGARTRRDIRILLRDGTAYYRRLVGSANLDDITERLVLDAALGAEVASHQVAAISFMTLSRLDVDAIELAWRRPDWVECAFTTRGIRNDL